jgi:hypothetical protein
MPVMARNSIGIYPVSVFAAWRTAGFLAVVNSKRSGKKLALGALLLWMSAMVSPNAAASIQRLDGFNVVATPNHPFGSPTAGRALTAARHLGATTMAIIPFLWQEAPSSSNVSAGNDMSDQTLRVAIQQVHQLVFFAVVKPHIWVPGSWAGAVAADSEQASWPASGQPPTRNDDQPLGNELQPA